MLDTVSIIPVAVDEEASFFVSPDGSDNNDGGIKKPFKTLQRGLAGIGDLSRGFNGAAGLKGAALFLRQGFYPLISTVFIGRKHSGMDGAPVFISAYGKERVSISSSVLIPGEVFEKDSGVGGYMVDLAAMGIHDNLNITKGQAYPLVFFGDERLKCMLTEEPVLQPGMWHFNNISNRLYISPPNGADMHDSEVYLAVSAFELFNLSDTENLVLNGLFFEKSLGSAVTVNGGRSVTIQNCAISNVGGRGISFNACDSGRVIMSSVMMTGSFPIVLAGSCNCVIDNNLLSEGSRWTGQEDAVHII